MGIPLMIQEEDNRRIEHLKKDCGIQKKIDVIRAGLALLEKAVEHEKKVARWKHAAKIAAKTSRTINKEFQKHAGIKSS